MVAFLKDPTGAPLWEENPEAKDVVHIETEKVSISFKARRRSTFHPRCLAGVGTA